MEIEIESFVYPGLRFQDFGSERTFLWLSFDITINQAYYQSTNCPRWFHSWLRMHSLFSEMKLSGVETLSARMMINDVSLENKS
jgi:hypothetical protein